MLKIPKGLKKKKKDKKNKHKEDELFNKEDLDKYRREHQQQQKPPLADFDQGAAGQGTSSTQLQPGPSTSAEQSDEWQKYKALTAGIDDVLKKTQGDLDRIKSTSFFQRIPPPSSETKQKKEVEETSQPLEEEVLNKKVEPTEEHKLPQDTRDGDEADDEGSDVDDTLFDTSYIDAISSGEVQLAYIPESPVEEDNGFDPFDTSIADKYINPKKRYLNLGCAVQVLSGKAASNVSTEKKYPRKRRGPVDLLLTSFDEGDDTKTDIPPTGITPVDSPIRTLLDADPLDTNLATSPVHVHENLILKFVKKEPVVEVLESERLSKFVSSDSIEDEFEKLASDSLAKNSDAFLDAENNEEVTDTVEAEATPFVTHFETQFEKNLNGSFLNIEKRDVFGSVTDLSKVGHVPIEPKISDEATEEIEFVDPFDTSVVGSLTLPGKQEIKLLEKELLQDIKHPPLPPILVESDDDFDPRAESSNDIKIKRPDSFGAPVEKYLKSDFVKSPSDRPDFLKCEQDQFADSATKPLTPLLPEASDSSNQEEQVEFVDPFDTSRISSSLGKLELKLIEKELVNTPEVGDFNPRANNSILNKFTLDNSAQSPTSLEEKQISDILTGEYNLLDTLHTPVEPERFVTEETLSYNDPFDTSIADNIKPGQTELKLLETELI